MRAALTALAVSCAFTAAGCGGARQETTATVAPKRAPAAPAGLRVAIVGELAVKPVPGASIDRVGSLAATLSYPLVVVSARAVDIAQAGAMAARDPSTHYAYVGASTKGYRHANLVGLVLDDAQAARLGGIVAGLVAAEQGSHARAAWIGAAGSALAGAFAGGAQSVNPGVTVLRIPAGPLPASCKEAALGAIARGSVVVMAERGLCADAAIAGAHQQNLAGLRIADFELPDVPVGILVRDAVAGVYRGGEDVVFGASTGAVGIRSLDPRISEAVAMRARSAAQQLASGSPPSG